MKLSSFKVGEYAVDSDGEVVKILKKRGRGDNTEFQLEAIKSGDNITRNIGEVFDECMPYGNDNYDEWERWTPTSGNQGDECMPYGNDNYDEWERWTPTSGNQGILKKIQEAKKNLEDLEKAYNDSLKPKVEFIPGMAYDLSQCLNVDQPFGVFTRIDVEGDNRFIVPNNGDSEYYITPENSQNAKPLTKPNQKKAAKIIYDFFKEGKFPEN